MGKFDMATGHGTQRLLLLVKDFEFCLQKPGSSEESEDVNGITKTNWSCWKTGPEIMLGEWYIHYIHPYIHIYVHIYIHRYVRTCTHTYIT
jgi:hypothetical protein